MAEVSIDHAEVYRADDGYRWRSVAGNHEVVASGEAYVHKADAIAAAQVSIPEGTPIEIQE